MPPAYLDSGLRGTSMPNNRLRSGLSGARMMRQKHCRPTRSRSPIQSASATKQPDSQRTNLRCGNWSSHSTWKARAQNSSFPRISIVTSSGTASRRPPNGTRRWPANLAQLGQLIRDSPKTTSHPSCCQQLSRRQDSIGCANICATTRVLRTNSGSQKKSLPATWRSHLYSSA